MSIYTIGDLHLSFSEDKPMDVFGDNWKNHEEKIKQDWLKKVKEEDLVVIPGDFSWAMHLDDTKKDFEYLNELPGKKLLLKGNHDYWWETVTKMKNFLDENEFKNIDFIYNNSFEFEDTIITGTRGWSNNEDAQDNKKIFEREVARLKYGIKDALGTEEKMSKDIIVFMHYPPITKQDFQENNQSAFVQIMQKYNVKKCFYGHLHAHAIDDAVEGNYYGIEFKLVSADALKFELFKVK